MCHILSYNLADERKFSVFVRGGKIFNSTLLRPLQKLSKVRAVMLWPGWGLKGQYTI